MGKMLVKIAVVLLFAVGFPTKPATGQTYCNPINLSRQFSANYSADESLNDPTVVLFRNKYYLFASNAGGYWASGDLLSWKFIPDSNLPLDKKEPTATVIGDWLYFFASFTGTVYRTQDPDSGKWEEYTNSQLLSLIGDFAVFADTNGKVYCYYGCTNNSGVMFRELDTKNQLNPVGSPIVCQVKNPLKKDLKKAKANPDKTGNLTATGSWMTKYNGKYYYQCAEINKGSSIYSDVVYVSESPIGPFNYAANNPVLFIPEGYISGASKGSTFADKYGNWWYITTVSVRANSNRLNKLALFPAGFDENGNLFVKSDFADLPIVMPTARNTDIDRLDPEWALISDEATAQASTSAYPENSAIDDDVTSFWSARTGKRGEWLSLDLGSECMVNALQINFDLNKTTPNVSDSVKAFQYLVEYSADKKNWKKLIDKTTNTDYQQSAYDEVKTPVEARYLKITNYNVPQGTFAISELRVFGLGTHRKPKKVSELKVIRDYRDPQSVKLFWKKQSNTTGYNIRYGTEKDKLYHSCKVGKITKLSLHCPDKNKAYWFRIDAFNENGVAEGKPVMCR